MPRPKRQAAQTAPRELRFNAPATYELAATDGLQTAGSGLQPREFLGYAAVYGNTFQAYHPDLWEICDHVIEPWAFAQSIADHVAAGKTVPVYRDHCENIGPTRSLSEDATGLLVKGYISETSDGNDTLTLMRDGALNSMSVAFVTTDQRIETREDGSVLCHIIKGRLKEVTVCTWGANDEAGVEEVASEAARATDTRHPLDAAEAFAKASAALALNEVQIARVRSTVTALSALLPDAGTPPPVTTLAAAPAAAPAPTADQLSACADACSAAASACEEAIGASLAMGASGMAPMPALLDCIAVARACEGACQRGSIIAPDLADACDDCCEAVSTALAGMTDEALAECVQECDACSTACGPVAGPEDEPAGSSAMGAPPQKNTEAGQGQTGITAASEPNPGLEDNWQALADAELAYYDGRLGQGVN